MTQPDPFWPYDVGANISLVDPPIAHAPPVQHLMSNIPPQALARLARAITHWQGVGAQWVSLPWWAPAEFVQGTRPPHVTGLDTDTPHGQLLASGEQAFCWLGSLGQLPNSLCVGWTPCFRDENVFDQHHHYGFLKAELFQWVVSDGSATLDAKANKMVRQLVTQACQLFNLWLGEENIAAPSAVISPTPEGFDVLCVGVELGSYGYRFCPQTRQPYIYGTALAEPRFGEVLGLCKQEHV